MVRTILYLLSLAVVLCGSLSANAQSEKRITILYDAFGPPSSLKMDWGFAALIEYNGRRIIFVTPEITPGYLSTTSISSTST